MCIRRWNAPGDWAPEDTGNASGDEMDAQGTPTQGCSRDTYPRMLKGHLPKDAQGTPTEDTGNVAGDEKDEA